MKKFSWLFTMFLPFGAAYAQDAKKIHYSASRDINDVLTTKEIYLYPEFRQGQVFFKTGNTGTGKLNYNRLVKEMHFIDAKGDTLALAEIASVKYIAIGADSFYVDKGIYQVIGRYNQVMLAVKEVLRVVDHQKIGAYGMTSPAGAIESYNSVRLNQGTYNLAINENVLFAMDESFFLSIREKQFVPVSWGNIAKAFPSKKDKIAAYAEEQHIDLNKREDLKKLFAFCNSN